MVERPQSDAFEHRAADGSRFTREGWLRNIFGSSIQFQHRGETFHYEPESGPSTITAIVGRIGRQVLIAENAPPEGHLAPTTHESWKAAIVLIDPTHHEDGQKAAVEHLPAVGKPVAIFESLASHINAGSEPFILEANAIVPSESFWGFVQANEGQITSIQFEFIAPNMFGEADDYDAEMRQMHQEEKAQKARLSLESRDGLNLQTKRVQRAADYAIKGAGSIGARTKKGRRFNSKDKARRISIPNKDLPKDQQTLISRLFNRIFLRP